METQMKTKMKNGALLLITKPICGLAIYVYEKYNMSLDEFKEMTMLMEHLGLLKVEGITMSEKLILDKYIENEIKIAEK